MHAWGRACGRNAAAADCNGAPCIDSSSTWPLMCVARSGGSQECQTIFCLGQRGPACMRLEWLPQNKILVLAELHQTDNAVMRSLACYMELH